MKAASASIFWWGVAQGVVTRERHVAFASIVACDRGWYARGNVVGGQELGHRSGLLNQNCRFGSWILYDSRVLFASDLFD